MTEKQLEHSPVLLDETLDLLNLKPGMSVVDATLGLGGHSEAILKKIGPKGKLVVFEQDERNLKAAKKRLAKHAKQITFVHDNFEHFAKGLESAGLKAENSVDAILFDLGLSSPHVDDPMRGFSFMKEGPLDMRFDERNPLTAEKIVNGTREKELADIIFQYGEERQSRKIARRIVEARKKAPITSTTQLAEIISGEPKGSQRAWQKKKLHPATLTFQALRIAVNREMEVLESALEKVIDALKIGGNVAVISYHSLEDRLVKNTFRHYTQTCICPKELHVCQCNFEKKLYLLTRKPVISSILEVSQNPRSRSAKLRGAQRI